MIGLLLVATLLIFLACASGIYYGWHRGWEDRDAALDMARSCPLCGRRLIGHCPEGCYQEVP